MKLMGRVAVVTGASRGIGRAIALALGREGAVVAGCAIQGPFDNRGHAADFLSELPSAQRGRSFLSACDVTRAADVHRFRDEVLQILGPPHILVNNAGIVIRRAFDDMADDEWGAVLDANLTSTFLVTRAFLPSLRQQPRGHIINVASIAGRQGTPMLSAYCAAKHGVIGLTRALAEELRPAGIAVNAICPGSTDTDMLKIGMPGGKPNMTPDDVARVALFLAADAPPALTGSCLDVFG